MKVPGIEDVTETFLSASVVELNPHGNVDPKAGLLAVFETHVRGMLIDAIAFGFRLDEGQEYSEAASAAERHVERILSHLKEPRHD